MLHRIFVACLTGFLILPTVSAEDSDRTESDADTNEALWITSIAPLGDDFVAGRASGLLLRPGAVMKFSLADVSEGKFEQLYEHPAAVWCIDSTTDGKTIASVDYKGNLGVYRTADGSATMHEGAFERWCQSLVVAPDDQSVVAGNEAGKLMVWSLSEAKVSKSIEVSKASITCLAFSPAASLLAAADGAGVVHLFSWPALEAQGSIKISEETAWSVAFENDTMLVAGAADRTIYRAEAKDQATPEKLAEGSDWITRLAVSPGGSIAAAEVSGKIHFASGGDHSSLEADSGVWALCFAGSGQVLVGTRKDGIQIAGQAWSWRDDGAAGESP
ncbi:MAG: hypothetical protein AAGJ83_00255 [Planctomycetota bacterium]